MSALCVALVVALLCGSGAVMLAKSPPRQESSATRQSSPAQPRADTAQMPVMPLTSISKDRQTATPAPSTPAAAPPAPQRSRPAARPAASGRRGRETRPEPALPFDASLETILFSPDRRLALVDGRIVQIGDLVRGARITEITETTVILRDANNRLRVLSMGGSR
jgi:hypothetical protein